MRGFAEPMPAEKPTPISPEGKRAAERVRTIFYSIAAANLVVVAIVIWKGCHADKPHAADPTKPAAVENGMPQKEALAPDGTRRGEGSGSSR